MKLELTKVVKDGESITQLSREIGDRLDKHSQALDKENSKGIHDQAAIRAPRLKDQSSIRDTTAGLLRNEQLTETIHSR